MNNNEEQSSDSSEGLYYFDIHVCDNDIDRDNERFSLSALADISDKLPGVTIISDHDASSKNQIGRVESAEVVLDTQKLTKTGEPFFKVRAKGYVPINKKALVEDIKLGIKKEVSISACAVSRWCDECKKEWLQTGCNHIGSTVVLSNISDVYELSFVAIPSQRNAGVERSEILKNYIEKSKLKIRGLVNEG